MLENTQFLSQLKNLLQALHNEDIENLDNVFIITEDDNDITNRQFFGVESDQTLKAGIYYYHGNEVLKVQAADNFGYKVQTIGTIN